MIQVAPAAVLARVSFCHEPWASSAVIDGASVERGGVGTNFPWTDRYLARLVCPGGVLVLVNLRIGSASAVSTMPYDDVEMFKCISAIWIWGSDTRQVFQSGTQFPERL